MKYKLLEMPEDFLSDLDESEFVRESLYYISNDERVIRSFFRADTLYPISRSETYVRVIGKLQAVIDEGKKIVISGDYDCDGICATTLLYRYLSKTMGNVGYYLPHRKNDGYGLSSKLVDMYHERGYEVIICVDNGVVAHEAISHAYELGMEVIVLDHHEMDEKTATYDYVLHPLLMEDPYHYLCGSGVVFEVLRSFKDVDEYDMALAALAAIGDMMEIVGENRIVVRLGLKYLNETRDDHFMALAENPEVIDDATLGMRIAPKLNAVGRMYNLANVNTMVRYLLLPRDDDIRGVSYQILDVNNERRKLTKITSDMISKEIDLDKDYIIYAGDVHEGIVGLIASQLVNAYHKPCFIFHKEDGLLKGSCRSVNGIDLIDMCRGNELLETFGGHKLAGGISLKEDNYTKFVAYVDTYMKEHEILDDEEVVIDLERLAFSLRDVIRLQELRPYIRLSNSPLYAIRVKGDECLYLKEGKHAKWKLNEGCEMVFFNIPEDIKGRDDVTYICQASINSYKGFKKANFMVVDYYK